LQVKEGTVVLATLIEPHTSTKNKDTAVEPEMNSIK
jgi:hypothetical protein